MSQFDALMAYAGRPVLFQQFGRVIIYRARNADDVSLTALVGDIRDDPLTDEENGGLVRTQRRTVTSTTDVADAYGGIGATKRNAEFVIDAQVWGIENVTSESDGMVTFECVRIGQVNKGRQGFRS